MFENYEREIFNLPYRYISHKKILHKISIQRSHLEIICSLRSIPTRLMNAFK